MKVRGPASRIGPGQVLGLGVQDVSPGLGFVGRRSVEGLRLRVMFPYVYFRVYRASAGCAAPGFGVVFGVTSPTACFVFRGCAASAGDVSL